MTDNIQRDSLDIATELTLLYYKSHSVDSKEDIQDTYFRFYAIAETARRTSQRDFLNYLPENIKTIIS